MKRCLINDRHELFKKIKGNFPNLQLDIYSDNFYEQAMQYVKVNEEDPSTDKIYEDDGHGDIYHIHGDYSYNIVVSNKR